MSTRALSVLLAVMLAAPLAAQPAAQPTLGAQRGDRVRIGPPEGALDRSFQRCTARVASVLQDTLLLASAANCLRGTYDASVEVALIDRGSREKHAFVGFAGGAVLGAVLGRLLAGDGCTSSGCADGDLATVLLTIAGSGVGAIIGTVVGVALPAGTTWGPSTSRQPIRVAGVALRPAIQLSQVSRTRR